MPDNQVNIVFSRSVAGLKNLQTPYRETSWVRRFHTKQDCAHINPLTPVTKEVLVIFVCQQDYTATKTGAGEKQDNEAKWVLTFLFFFKYQMNLAYWKLTKLAPVAKEKGSFVCFDLLFIYLLSATPWEIYNSLFIKNKLAKVALHI